MALRRWLFLIVICGVIAGLVGYVVAAGQSRTYTATAQVLFNDDSLSLQAAGLQPASGGIPETEQETNVKLLGLGVNADRTAAAMRPRLTAAQVSEHVSVSGDVTSDIVDVTADFGSARLAADVANAYAAGFVARRTGAQRAALRSALALVRRELAAIPAPQRSSSAALALQSRAQSLAILANLTVDASVAQRASVPSAASAPHVARTVAVAAVVGLALGLLAALGLERLGSVIRDPEQLRRRYGLPLLAAIGRGPRSGARAATAQACDMALARLRHLCGEHLSAVLVTAARREEGTTTIAINLALAGARAGEQVLLVDLDHGDRSVMNRLGLSPQASIASVLRGDCELVDAVVRTRADAPQDGDPEFDVAGDDPDGGPQPRASASPRALEELLVVASRTYSMVVIDAAPMTIAPDAMAVLPRVDGVVVVGRVGHTTRQAVSQLSELLAVRGAHGVGLIVNAGPQILGLGSGGRQRDRKPASVAR